MKNGSPCTNACQYDPRNKWCLGCGRPAEEIKPWKKLSPFHKTKSSFDSKRRPSKVN